MPKPKNPAKEADKLAREGIKATKRAVEASASPLKRKHRNAANDPVKAEAIKGSSFSDPTLKKARNRLEYLKKKAKREGKTLEQVKAEMAARPDEDGRKFNKPPSINTILAPGEMALPIPCDPLKATDSGEWKWDKTKLAVAEALAEGHTIKDVALAYGGGRTTIYEWLNHPSGEMRRYMDALIVETSIANKRLRIARLLRINDQLFNVAEAKFGQMLEESGSGRTQISEESLKGIVSELRETSVLIAKERMELVDVVQTNNTNTNVNIDGTKTVEDYLQSLPEDEQLKKRAEFVAIGDKIIAKYTQ